MQISSGAMRVRLLIAVGTIVACTSRVVVVSPHDAALDEGLQEFKEKLNLLVVDAASSSGDNATFEHYKKGYVELEMKLALLRDRAAILEAEDTQCDVSPKLKKLMERLPSGSKVLQFSTGPGPTFANAPVPISPLAIGKRRDLPYAVGCMTRLIDNVADQLTAIETLHSDPTFCAVPSTPPLTCIRPAVVQGLLGLANSSLDAALLVQIYKRKEAEQTP